MELPNHAPGWVQDAFVQGYKEALLDVYCYMTGNPQLEEYPERLTMIDNMLDSAAKNGNRLEWVE